jgi:hypothetical protein
MIKINYWFALRIALITGIVILASKNLEGWGWLVLLLFITIDKNDKQ